MAARKKALTNGASLFEAQETASDRRWRRALFIPRRGIGERFGKAIDPIKISTHLF